MPLWGRRKHREAGEPGEGAWLVAGLGNPGPEYERTRHNVGFRVAERLAERLGGARFKSGRANAFVAETRDGDARIVLAKPITFMNESGRSVGPLAKYFKVPAGRVVVVHDEIDLPFGTIRVKIGGGTAGHNGIRSIVQHLHTPEFVRVRVGVGRPSGSRQAAGHVLDAFGKDEEKELPLVIDDAADAVLLIVRDGADGAQNAVNTR